MIFLCVLCGVFLICFLLLCFPITVLAGYDGKFRLQVQYLFLRFSPGQEKTGKKEGRSAAKKSKPVKQGMDYFNELFRQNSLPDAISALCTVLQNAVEKSLRILRRSTMRRFSLKIVEHDTDAAVAAIDYGKICAVVYPLLGYLNSIIKFKRQKIEIFCDYTCLKSSFQFDMKWQVIPLFCFGPLLSFIYDLVKNKGR